MRVEFKVQSTTEHFSCVRLVSRYDAFVSDAYTQLLDAAIQHLEELKSCGVKHVAVSKETLDALTRSSPRPSPPPPTQAPKPTLTTPTLPAMPASQTNPAQTTRPLMRDLATSAPPPQPSVSAPRTGAEKAAAFAGLRQRVLVCTQCPHLASARKSVVFGVGNIDAKLMFVGEAPGADEDEKGEPFVGKAGQLLTRIIETMGLTRSDVYIGNILKCRPDTPGQTAGNRKPTSDEMATCIPYLHEQIDLIRPRVIVALGATAVEGLLGKTLGITKLRGTWKTYRDTPLMPTYHPAYLLRNQSLSEKRKVWEDMLQVMEKLEMSISEKQQRFFLSK